MAVIAVGESKTVVAGLDALTGSQTYREEFNVKVASAVPLGVKDGQERSVIMLVDRWGRRRWSRALARPHALGGVVLLLCGSHAVVVAGGSSGGLKLCVFWSMLPCCGRRSTGQRWSGYMQGLRSMFQPVAEYLGDPPFKEWCTRTRQPNVTAQHAPPSPFIVSDKLVHSVPSTAEASSALRSLLPQLFYHDLSDAGLESFSVVEKDAKDSKNEGGPLGSAVVASLPFHPSR